MIDRHEIMAIAGELSLRPSTVEKDYVLGWLLAGIYSSSALKDHWVFKGGTCLKKCFFETYRFSEDLDFTLLDRSHLDEGFLVETFRTILEWVYENSGVELPDEKLRFEVYENNRGGLSCEGRVYYRGPIAPRGDLPRIKLDLTVDELLVLEAQALKIDHPYTDEAAITVPALCYTFEEVFAEKIRALGERARPRDLYDVINLHRRPEAAGLAAGVRAVLSKKCEYKGIDLPTLSSLEPFKDALVGDWAAMLEHQLLQLPPFESYWDDLPELFEWLAERRSHRPSRPIPNATGKLLGTGRLHGAGWAGGRTGILETIRFAASNRLCVDLTYKGSTRTIEPYSLRRTKDGNILLYAVRSRDGGHRSYRLDRIQRARVSRLSFVPRYTVEFTPSGSLRIPRTAVPATFGMSRPSKATRKSSRPVHVYKCSSCGKEFRRKTRTNRNRDRQHTSPGGGTCHGRTSYYVRTE